MLKEGNVVLVVGKLDDRVRNNNEEFTYGTLIHITRETVWVLLTNGNIWIGKPFEVVLQENKEEVNGSET